MISLKIVTSIGIKTTSKSRFGPLKWLGPSTDIIVENSKKEKHIVTISQLLYQNI